MAEELRPIYKPMGIAPRYLSALISDPVSLYREGPFRVVFADGSARQYEVDRPPLGIVHEVSGSFFPWHVVVSLVGPIMMPPRDPEED